MDYLFELFAEARNLRLGKSTILFAKTWPANVVFASLRKCQGKVRSVLYIIDCHSWLSENRAKPSSMGTISNPNYTCRQHCYRVVSKGKYRFRREFQAWSLTKVCMCLTYRKDDTCC